MTPECAACTLHRVARGKLGAEATAAGGGIEALLHCLRTSSDTAVQAQAAGALCRLAGVLEAAFPQPGCVPSLVCVLRSSGNEDVLRQVAAALGNLFRYIPGCAAAGAAAGCIPRLVQLFGSSSNQSVRQFALAATVCLLLGSPDTAAAVEAAGGRAALQRLNGSGDERLQSCAAAALRLLDEYAEPAGDPAAAGEARPAAAAQPSPSAAALPPAPRVCAAESCTSSVHLKRCGGCGRVRYCSVACRDSHWRAHRRDCKRWRAEAEASAAAAEGPSAMQP